MAASTLPAQPIVFYDLHPAPGGCPFAQRAKIVVKEKGIPIDLRLITKDAKPEEFLSVFRKVTANPNGRGTVPTIIDGDVKLTESHVISEYLDNAYPKAGTKLLPTDPQLLAQVRLFVELYSSEVQPHTYKPITVTTKQEFNDAVSAWLAGIKIIDAFLRDHALPGGDFLLGGDFSYAEAATLPFAYRAFLNLKSLRDTDAWQLLQEHKLDRFAAWAKAGFARPSVKESLPADEELVSRVRERLQVAPLQ